MKKKQQCRDRSSEERKWIIHIASVGRQNDIKIEKKKRSFSHSGYILYKVNKSLNKQAISIISYIMKCLKTIADRKWTEKQYRPLIQLSF